MFIGADEFNSGAFRIDCHQNTFPSSNSIRSTSINDSNFRVSLKHWVREKMQNGSTGKELFDMITSEVELQNGGKDKSQQPSMIRSNLTPEKMKLVAPAILSKILQSEAFNRYF